MSLAKKKGASPALLFREPAKSAFARLHGFGLGEVAHAAAHVGAGRRKTKGEQREEEYGETHSFYYRSDSRIRFRVSRIVGSTLTSARA